MNTWLMQNLANGLAYPLSKSNRNKGHQNAKIKPGKQSQSYQAEDWRELFTKKAIANHRSERSSDNGNNQSMKGLLQTND